MAIDTELATVATENAAWAEASLAWLAGLAENTQRAYRVAWTELIASSGRMPWEISRVDVVRWMDRMVGKGQSAATIRLRLAGISSFFRFVGLYIVQREDGTEAALFDASNPAAVRFGGKSAYAARYLNVEECKALLRAIRSCTGTQASRDYALFLCYLMMGRRNTEIRLLKWGDIERAGGETWYRWSGKGKMNQRTLMPEVCAEAIWTYLRAARRLTDIGPEEYVFVPLNDHGERLKPTRKSPLQSPPAPLLQGGRPLSSRQVGRLLKKYCTLAGLQAGNVHVHTLRHSAAMLRKAAGDDFGEIQALLGHARLSTTQTYLHYLEGQVDSSWGKVADLLGLIDSTVAPGRRNFQKRR